MKLHLSWSLPPPPPSITIFSSATPLHVAPEVFQKIEQEIQNWAYVLENSREKNWIIFLKSTNRLPLPQRRIYIRPSSLPSPPPRIFFGKIFFSQNHTKLLQKKNYKLGKVSVSPRNLRNLKWKITFYRKAKNKIWPCPRERNAEYCKPSPDSVYCWKRYAMFWNVWKNNFLIYFRFFCLTKFSF